MIIALILIYFTINIFSAGYVIGDDWRFSNELSERIYLILIGLALMFFGCIIFAGIIIVALLSVLYDLQNKYTQTNFWWAWYVTKDFVGLNEEQIKFMEDVLSKSTTNSRVHRTNRKQLGMIFKLNNYTPKNKSND